MAEEPITPAPPTGGDGGNGGDTNRTLTYTQKEFDDIVGERLARERKKYADYDELKAQAAKLAEIEDSKKSDLEKLAGERDTLRSELEPTKLENLRLKVALEKGLVGEKAGLADRLKGTTKEELEADADELLQFVSAPAGGGALDGGARTPVQSGRSMNDMLRDSAIGR